MKIKEVMLNLIDKAKEVAVETDKEVVVDVVAEAVEVTTIKTLMSIVRFAILTTSSTKKFKTIANMDVSKEDLLM